MVPTKEERSPSYVRYRTYSAHLRSVALGITCFLLGLIGGMGAVSHSQPYVGAALGYSHAEFPPSTNEGCWTCSTSYEQSTDAPQGMVFAGYQFKYLALELGAGSLSTYRCHNVGAFTSGPYDIRQEIDTRMSYVRGLVSYPMGNWKPFMSLGVARVTMKNHEYGYNDPSLQFVEQLNYDVRTKPLYGAGIVYDFGRVAVRAELTRVDTVAVSHWTAHQDVTAGWLGLIVKF